jgi:hypothetical protein
VVLRNNADQASRIVCASGKNRVPCGCRRWASSTNQFPNWRPHLQANLAEQNLADRAAHLSGPLDGCPELMNIHLSIGYCAPVYARGSSRRAITQAR